MGYNGGLHNHSCYSNAYLRDSTNQINESIDYAIKLGHRAYALTDHECICGHIKAQNYYQKVKKDHPEFKLILGNEIYLCRNGLNADNYNKDYDYYYHFILLAKDHIGHKQIAELSTRAYKRSYMARGMRRRPTYYNDLFEVIGKNPGHVIGSTACLGGALPKQILKAMSDPTLNDKINTWICQMQKLFGADNFYFEMQPSYNKDQVYVNNWLKTTSKDFDVPYIITTDSHYLKKEDRVVHKAYLKAQNGEREVDDFYATTYMMDTEELESYFNYFSKSELEEAYKNIDNIIDQCQDYVLAKPLKIPTLKWREVDCNLGYKDREYLYDKIPALRKFLVSEHESDRYLVEALLEGINKHTDLQNQEAYDKINEALEMTWESSEVNKARWSAYYLNLQNILDECWKAGTIVGPGRGSGVGFILLYALDITQINPLRETTRTEPWRFLNPARVSVLDIDVDIEGGKRAQVLSHLRKVYGSDRVTNVVTFKTETTKSAILTAARGLGIDVDVASYIASLVPADRGMLRSLSQCMYGDEENDMKPIKQFVFEMTENYPELWNVASKIEGLVCGIGMHAGGIIFVDEPFTESTALMRAPDGTLCTQYDLHNCEAVSLIKYDLLSVEAMDKIHTCIDLLCNYGYAEQKNTLKETYESIIGIYNLDRNSSRMWDMVYNHEINSLFQMEKDSGVNGIKLARPTSVDDLATLNSVIRLMAQEKGGEMPLNKFARFKEDIQQWYDEMTEWGLTENEQELLKEQLQVSYGICESQEKFMTLVQTPECGGFDLMWADRLRKSIAKKNPKEFDQLTTEYFANAKEKGLSENLCNYVWNVLVAYSRGYGFNSSHTLAYSLIALQEMNLAYRFPIIFWNCACLIVDSGGSDEENDDLEEDVYVEEEYYYNEMEEFGADDSDDDIDSSYEEEDCDGYPAEVCQMSSDKKKKKVKTTNYGKIATAIGKIKTAGINVAPPDINNSTFTFSPNVDDNVIRYGLKGITRVSQDLIHEIINNRPYTSLEDFLSKVKVNKPQMINLIKSGMFDCFGSRIQIMRQYIDIIADKKKRVTLQNMKMLIDFNLIPERYSHQCKVYNFNKYLKKMKLDDYYGLDNRALYFYEQHFPVDELEITDTTESGMMIKQTIWDKFYQSNMDIIRPYVKEHNQELLTAINNRLYKEQWDKYCKGSISKWEMDSISCYIHEHELACIDHEEQYWVDFNELPETPEVDRIINIKGRQIPLFKLHQIAGTVLDRDKTKKTVTLLTTTGVVNVKIYGAFEEYDKQISAIGADGKKHVIEKSMFSRGSKIIVTGIRRDSTFLAKVYKNTGRHRVERIVDIDYETNQPIIRKERLTA